MPIYRLGSDEPRIHPDAWVHETAVIIGRVRIGPGASVWPGAVLRADNEPIEIGEGSNVQDGCVLHCDPGTPLRLGARVTVGHQAMLHGCVIEDDCLIGIQAVVLNGAHVGSGSLVGACALVPEGRQVPPGSLALGAPFRVVRAVSAQESERIRASADSYRQRAVLWRTQLHRVG